MMLRAQNLVTAIRLEASGAANGTPPPPDGHRAPPAIPTFRSPLSVLKPSWTVRTESNVFKARRKKPDPSCVICQGSGRVDCHHCHGKGRVNRTQLAMLPKGEWPQWCRTCGGSGLGYCSRCLGTGEYRGTMGFHFMKMDSNQNTKGAQVPEKEEKHSPSDWFLNHEPLDSRNER